MACSHGALALPAPPAMASFFSGVMISKSESDRQKGDARRMRKQGIDPSKAQDLAFCGAVISRRQHRVNRVDKEAEKDREEAEALPMDPLQIVAKRPEGRLKWLQKALMLASKKRGVQIGAVYDIVTQAKFVSGVGRGVGAQMQAMLMANLHLFSSKQQRALQADSSRFKDFERTGKKAERSEGEESEPRKPSGRLGEKKRRSPSRSRSRSRKRARRPARSRSRSRSRRSRSKSPKASASAKVPTEVKSAEGGSGSKEVKKRTPSPEKTEEAPAPALPVMPVVKMKMKMTAWQPLCIQQAVAAVEVEQSELQKASGTLPEKKRRSPSRSRSRSQSRSRAQARRQTTCSRSCSRSRRSRSQSRRGGRSGSPKASASATVPAEMESAEGSSGGRSAKWRTPSPEQAEEAPAPALPPKPVKMKMRGWQPLCIQQAVAAVTTPDR